MSPGEREYLRTHWQLLARLRKALRTQRDASLVVLYGSLARGDEDSGSDLDLLVSPSGERSLDVGDLAARVERVAGRRADVAHLARVEEVAPLLLERVLDEGRVLIDRDGQWHALHERRSAIRARAQRAHRRQMIAATSAIGELTG